MIKKINVILDSKQKSRIILFILSSIPLIFLETISISSLPIYLITILNPSKIFEYIDYQNLENIILNMSLTERSMYGLVIIFFIFLTKAIYHLLYNYLEFNTKKKINLEHSNRMYSYYLNESYLFHIQNNPSKLIQNIADVQRSTSVIFSIFNIFKELTLIFCIIGILAFSEPKILLIILLIFSLPIIFFLTYFKKTLKQKGEIAKKSRISILKNLQESFSLIKFIKIIGNQEYIKKNFELQNFRSLHQETIVAIIGRTPRIILELVTVLSISLIILFLFRSGQSFESMIPLLTLLVVSLVRFIPSVGIILVDINQYKFHHVSLSNIYNIFRLQDKKIKDKKLSNPDEKINKEIFLKKDIQFFDVDFSYPNSKKSSLKNLNFVIKKSSKTGIKGPTGSGKSTLIALLLGLLKPNRGEIRVDNKDIHNNLRGWQKGIGYVPQTIHLLDDTLKKNICFGISDDKIDNLKLEKVIQISGIDEFINNQPYKLNTIIGHNGARISGGQLQRIGIARALYLDPKILILDEPTSSLDEITEENIIKRILSLKELTVILISHNPKIIEKCDSVLVLKDQTVICNKI
tara:strand:- start:6458 stop:8191 length:1734 start_codon:yes stop_codon:yes gene_type:complete